MKVFGFIAAAGLLAWLAWFVASSREEDVAPGLRPVTAVADPPTTTSNDVTEVFKRAFWRRPGPNDTILHAERREWSGPDGVDRWQWFIAVEPSPELVKRLIEDNAFNLVPTKAPPEIQDAPDWFEFPPSKFEVFAAPHGNMCFFYRKTGNLLHACDAGGGFHPGAPEPVAPVSPPSAPPGRLSGTPPPNPPVR